MVSTMTPVTDPAILDQLNSSSSNSNNPGTPVTDPDLLNQLNGSQPQESSLMSKVGAVAKNYADSQSGSPQSLLQSVPPLLNKGADWLGNKATDYLSQGSNRTDPYTAAGVGTAIKMGPDIAMSFMNPEEGIAQNGQNEYAQLKGLKAMGAPKRIFKTPQSIDNAMNQSQTLLDQGLIKPFRGAQGMADELGNLEQSSGQKIGEILGQMKDQGKFYNLQYGIDAVNSLRPKSQNGQILQGGQYDIINSKIDNAIDTIKAHTTQYEPASQTIVQTGFPTSETIPAGFKNVPVSSEKQRIFNGFKEAGSNINENPDINMWTGGQESTNPPQPYEIQKGKSIFGTYKDVSIPQNQVVGKNKKISIPAENIIVQRGGKPINLNGIEDTPQINFDEANQLKGKLQDIANYQSNKDATLLDKVIAGKFRGSLDSALDQAAQEMGNHPLSQEFQKQKQIYAATQFAKDPVYNRLSSELANKGLSLTDWILGTHAIGTGNPLAAVGEVAAKRLLERYGPSTQAYISNQLSKTPQIISGANKAYAASKVLNETKAMEYLDKANGDKDKARQMAKQDGYQF